jgi:hypothetical protein
VFAPSLFDIGPSHALITRGWHSEMGVPSSLRRVTTVSSYVAFGLATIAIFGFVRRRRGPPEVPIFLVLFPLVMYLSVIPINGGMRYRLPIDSFVLLAAGAGVAALTSQRLPGGATAVGSRGE